MMTSLHASRLLIPLLFLLIGQYEPVRSACVSNWSGRWNNCPETATESYSIGTHSQATGVSLSGRETADELDISLYFDISIKGTDIVLTPKPTLPGVKDFPVNKKRIGAGNATIICPGETETQSVSVIVTDANTATPFFSASTYSVEVDENYPLSLEIVDLDFVASDYDSDANNNLVTFSLEGPSNTFTLTEPVQTSTTPANYSARLMLTQPLDWSFQQEYKFNLTATDPGGLKSSSNVTVKVKDFDNKPPEFKYTGYTTEALDRKALGPLTVKPDTILAADPDTGDPLKYSLLDLPEASWAQYFSLDANSAALSLAMEIPDDVTTPSEISLVIQAKETEGAQFVSTAVLVVYLTPQEGEEPSTTGYIVGLAVLGCLVLILLVVAGVLYQRGKRPALPPLPASHVEADWESGPGSSGHSAPLSQSKAPKSTSHEPAEQPAAYDNLGYRAEQASAPTSFMVESDERQEAPPAASSLYPPLHADRPIDDADAPAPPMGARPAEVSAASQPISEVGAASQPISADPAPPEEPRPDYAAKSVGFKDTVLCVTPVEAADVEQVDEDDEDDVEEDAEEAGHDGAKGEDQEGAGNSSDDKSGEEDDKL